MRTMSTTMKRLIASLAVIATLIVGLPLTGVVAYADDQIVGNADENTVIQTADETPAQPAPQADLLGYYMGYKESPQGNEGDEIYPDEDGRIAPGFRWVAADKNNPAHYEIYKAVDDPELGATHEDVIGWWYFAYYSHKYNFEDYLIQLEDDLDFTKYEFERNGGDRRQLAVGTEEVPFKGTFDGKSHTISKVDNHRDGLWIETDCGFFGVVQEAVIKNINFKDCYVGASYRGGLVAGYAQDTLFMNIKATNCTTSVIPPNNVINLITNAGMSAGMIVGEANGSTLYNCEMEGGRVVNNATSGVGALGGQPLYLGGLVGWCNDTVIEYSRVTDIENEDGTYTPAKVENKYGTAVSVANFSELFTGGIVGGMKAQDSGSKVVDCYSTADVYSEAAIYFGVGLGLGVTRGYTGGIAGIVQEGSEVDGKDAADLNLIERVSFAGDLSSYNYNIILLGIPAIETDKYLGGITGRGGGNATIVDAYYMRHTNSAGFGSDTDKDIYDYKTSYDGGVNDGVNFGDRDGDYTDREFWEGSDFDFAGGKLRDLGYDFTEQVQDSEWKNDHYNKWVMDYDRGMPVHGGSIKATMDYPGSGTVTIGTTSLSSNSDDIPEEDRDWKTSNPYDFAVQGYEEGDSPIDITYDITPQAPDGSSWASDSRNQGYRFMGWYRSRDVQVNDIAENHDLFTTPNRTLNTADGDDGLISDTYEVQDNTDYTKTSYTLDVSKPATDEGEDEKTDYYDNDLYLAYAQAQALLHDVSGNLVAPGTGTSDSDLSNDWYDYGQTLTLPTSIVSDADKVSDTAILAGWTTIKNSVDTYKGAYVGITSDALNNLKNQGEFFDAGSDFTVVEPENLYPVYTDLISNVKVIFEGNERDAADEEGLPDNNNVAKRDGFGQAYVRVDNTDAGNPRYYVAIDDLDMADTDTVDGKLGKGPISSSYTDLDTNTQRATVRFLGWYETVTGDDGSKISVRVSDSPVFYLDDVDLTQEHTYTARFEYCIRYWWDADASGNQEKPYSEDWVEYKDPRYDPKVSGTNDHFTGWKTGAKDSDEVLNANDNLDYQIKGNENSTVVEEHYGPLSFHGTWADIDEAATNVDIKVVTDFPTGPQFTVHFDGTADDDVQVVMPQENGFNFHLWAADSTNHSIFSGDWRDAREEADWTVEAGAGWGRTSAGYHYGFIGHVTADVTFHGKPSDNANSTTVERRYEMPVMQADDGTYKYYLNENEDVNISGVNSTYSYAAGPTDKEMERGGYIFLGWIDKNAISNDEFKYIFNGEPITGTDVKLVKDVTRAKPYIMDGTEEVVRHPMDLYPVYTTFIVETDTNIRNNGQSAVDESVYNIPRDPAVANGGNADSTVKLNYNKDNGTLTSANGAPGPEPSATSPVGISYTNYELNDFGNIRAEIKVTPERNTPLYKEPQTGETKTYELKSLSVLVDGAEVDNLPVSRISDDGFFAYTIEAGVSYTFRANYSPVPVQVIYHLDGDGGTDVTEKFDANVGDLLPNTTKTPSFDFYKNRFFVGWVVNNADNAGPVEWNGVDEIDFAEPGVDTVTGTTHLWPVYRQGSVFVNSNIDNKIENKEQIRYTEVRGDSLYLVAKDVDGYRFDGWYTGYVDENNRGTSLTTEYEYPLTGDNRFNGTIYTAVYTDMGDIPQVQYHDTGGNVIYTAYAEGEDKWRTFLDEVTYNKPVFDENGDPVLDENGNQVTQKVKEKVIIDLDAFNIINAELNEANSADANAYEEFVTWQWVDNGKATPERWGKDENDKENFINKMVASNVGADNVMHLYPVTIKLTATAPSDTGAYLGGLKVTGLNRNDETDQLESANVTLLSDYTKPWLKVNLTEYAYNKGDGNEAAKSAADPQEKVTVNLYAPKSSVGSPLATATTVANTVTDQGPVDLVPGDALFLFDGYLTITKTVDEASEGDVFVFTVSDGTESRNVAIPVTATKDADDKVTGFTGTATVKLPYGQYTVAEDDAWSWRWDGALSSPPDVENGSASGITVQVGYGGIGSDGKPEATKVECVNTLAKTKWFSGADHAKNVFGATKVGE